MRTVKPVKVSFKTSKHTINIGSKVKAKPKKKVSITEPIITKELETLIEKLYSEEIEKEVITASEETINCEYCGEPFSGRAYIYENYTSICKPCYKTLKKTKREN